jgi:hypothetical protein
MTVPSRLRRATTTLICALAMFTAVTACKKKAILTKPIDQLQEQDMIAAATAMGWGDKPTSTHSTGADETILVSGDKEDPAGTDSPDGKKRVRFSIGLYLEKPDSVEAEKKSLAEGGAAIEVSGTRILTAEYVTGKGPDTAEAKKILDRLLGR